MVYVMQTNMLHSPLRALTAILDIAAFPDSVNVLGGVSGDVRTPDKLVDGVCDTDDGRHMWLAPILPDVVSGRRSGI